MQADRENSHELRMNCGETVMAESNEGKPRDGRANLVPFKPGAEWNGNAGGRPKGFRRLLRDIMTRRELCGEPVPADAQSRRP